MKKIADVKVDDGDLKQVPVAGNGPASHPGAGVGQTSPDVEPSNQRVDRSVSMI